MIGLIHFRAFSIEVSMFEAQADHNSKIFNILELAFNHFFTQLNSNEVVYSHAEDMDSSNLKLVIISSLVGRSLFRSLSSYPE